MDLDEGKCNPEKPTSQVLTKAAETQGCTMEVICRTGKVLGTCMSLDRQLLKT